MLSGTCFHSSQPEVETASRIRGRIEKVIEYAEGQGLRSGSNPARLSPALSGLLGGEPAKSGGNHSALSYDHVAKFFAQLKDRQASSAVV